MLIAFSNALHSCFFSFFVTIREMTKGEMNPWRPERPFFSKINGATYWKRYRRRRSRKKENATRKGINSYRILL